MAIGNHNDLTHIVRTSDQWKNTYDKYELIPAGVLCVELVSPDVTKIKIGDGHNIFSKLPYIGDLDLSKYYTKLETDARIKEILAQEKVVRIKGIIGSKSDLPADARCGDIYFVRQLSSSDNKYIEYIYSPDNTWEPLGGIPVDIDLSEYAKTAYVDDKIEQVNERIDDIEQQGTHTHPNKEILDQITEPYTTADKETLASLHNYDDTEIREMISQSSHTHANKDILDATSAAFTKEDKSKLDQLNPYDDSTIKERITELERVAHEHSNKRILDQTTASFTKDYERKMRWIRIYTGCTGMEEGIAGLVPAAQAGEEDYVLSGSGEWVPQTGGGGTYTLPIASASTLGGIKVGNGLTIDANGVLSADGGGSGGDSIAEGDGITITTDPQTGVKTISVNTGDHLEVDENTGELNVTDVDYTAGHGIHIGADYTLIEYIKNSGNYDQIILTDMIPSSTDRFEMDVKFGAATGLENNQSMCGAVGTNQGYYIPIWVDNTNSSNNIAVYNHFAWQSGRDSHRINVNDTIKYEGNNPRQLLTVTRDTMTWGNATTNFLDQIDPSFSELTIPIAIFGRNIYNTGFAIFTMMELFVYGVKLYDSNNILLHDLRPAERGTDGEAGLYDLVTHKFYGNAGNGSFVKGPPVSSVDDRLISAKIGNGLQFDSNDAIEVNVGDGLYIDSTDNDINVKYGDGLTLNSSNELEVNVGQRLKIEQDGSVNAKGYIAGTGISIDLTDYSLPSGYTRIKALSSTLNGNQYINTGYRLNPNSEIDMKCTLYKRETSIWAIPLGARVYNQYAVGGLLFVTTSSDSLVPSTGVDTPSLWIESSLNYPPAGQIELWYNDIVNLHFDNQSVTCENQRTLDQSVIISQTAISSTSNYDLYVFATNNGNNAEYFGVMDLYELTISENNTIIHRYIPCKRDSDDKYGLYDIIDDEFKLSPNNNLFSYVAGLPLDDVNETISLLPPTANTIGGVKAGTNITIDPDGTINATGGSSKLYEPGQGIIFDEATQEGQFKVRNLEYYFDTQVSCQINGNYGPRTFTRLPGNEQCLVAIVQTTSSGIIWTTPACIGLTETSCKYSNSYDSNIIGPDASFDYKGYTWYIGMNYGLMNSTGVDLLGNVQGPIDLTSIDTSNSHNLDLVGKAIIDLANLVVYEESIDVWGDGTGWLNGSYNDSQSDQFWTNWHYTYHSKQNEYLEVPAGAIKMRQIGISNENNSRFEGGAVDCFNSSHHHFATVGCVTDEWADIPEGTVYLQFGVKWNELNNRTISSSDIKSVTIEFYYDTPRNDTINAKLGNGLEFDSNDAIQVKLGTGLGFDADGALEVTGGGGGDTVEAGDGIDIDTDSQTGNKVISVDTGNGLQINQDGELEIDSSIIPEVPTYEAGTAISIEDVEHGGVIFDAWDNGTGWENVCYSNSTGNAVVTYTYEAHSPISNSYTLPAGATHIRAISYDQNDTMLWTSFSWIDANDYHFASTSPEEGHYSDWFEIPTGAVKVNFGVRHSKLNITTAMSLNDIKSVDITIQTVSDIEVDVWTGVTGWTNGDYYSGTSDTFTTSWPYTYHYNPSEYIPVPEGALKIRVIGISNENDSHFEGGGANIFDSNHHHIGWIPCCTITDEWVDIPEGTVYVQPEVKWNNNNTRTISAADIKSVILVWKLPALEINQAINVKYGNGLTVNQNNELEVKLGDGLSIDEDGAIEVTGGSGGDSIDEGNGITITTDSQTGIKTIGVNAGTGLDIDPLTNELFVNGQLPEGTIIKKLTYVGNGSGSSNVIKFTKKPVGILSINGSSGTNYISAIPTSINSEYLHGVFGGVNNNGVSCSCKMSYNDTTNELTFTQAAGGNNDAGLIYNVNGKTYTMQYLTKGHTGSGTSVNNEVSVVKTFSYVGTGTSTNNIQFPETPDYVLSISGPLGSVGDILAHPIDIEHPTSTSQYMFQWTQSNTSYVGRGTYTFSDSTNVLSLIGADYGGALNYTDNVYYVRYIVNEVIPTTMPYDAGEAISIETIGGLQLTNYSNDDFVDSIANVNAGSIVKAVDKSSFTLTATWDDCYTQGSDLQSNGSYPYNVKASTKYRFAWDSANPDKYGVVYVFENGQYGDMMHAANQHDASYIEFTTSPQTSYIQARFGITYVGNSITYSNVRLYEFIEDEDQYDEISVKYNKGLSVNQNNELEVNIGTGLSFDANGAIQVTGGGGGSGDTVAQGNGINITTDQQTGDKVISVNAGNGLQINQTTHALEATGVTSIAPTSNTPGSITLTNGDGTTTPVSVISQMGGAGASTAGSAGYVPAPASGDNDAYLRGDGVWDDDVLTEDDELTLVFVPDDYQPS